MISFIIPLNSDEFKYSEANKPRIFANTLKFGQNISEFKKGIFTICDYRENDKCPPWTIQASEILHDNKISNKIFESLCINLHKYSKFI